MAAEEKLGVMSPETDKQVRDAIERARAADEGGDEVACKEAACRSSARDRSLIVSLGRVLINRRRATVAQ